MQAFSFCQQQQVAAARVDWRLCPVAAVRLAPQRLHKGSRTRSAVRPQSGCFSGSSPEAAIIHTWPCWTRVCHGAAGWRCVATCACVSCCVCPLRGTRALEQCLCLLCCMPLTAASVVTDAACAGCAREVASGACVFGSIVRSATHGQPPSAWVSACDASQGHHHMGFASPQGK